MELSQYLRIFRTHWLGLVLLTLCGLSLGGAWAVLQPRVYTASASALVLAPHEGDTESKRSANLAAQQSVPTVLTIAESAAVASRVSEEVGLAIDLDELLSEVSVTSPVQSATVKIAAQGATPEQARDLTDAWLEALIAQMNVLETGNAETRGTVYLTTIDQARLPKHPSSPKVALVLTLGGMLGVAAGVAYALLRSALDRRIRSTEAVQDELGLTVLGKVPHEKSLYGKAPALVPASPTSAARGYAFLEAMRSLRTNLQFANVDQPPRTIVVTSPLQGDGKSTVASNLALVLAAKGERVVLVDADLRRPRVASILGLMGEGGLSDVLAGRAEMHDVLQRVPGTPTLAVLTAGSIPPNPSEILGSGRMSDLLSSLASGATVIVDAPPVLPVTDAVVLAGQVDGVLVVASVAKTRTNELADACSGVALGGGRVLGVVLNRIPRHAQGVGYYGGEYYAADAGQGVVGPVSTQAKMREGV